MSPNQAVLKPIAIRKKYRLISRRSPQEVAPYTVWKQTGCPSFTGPFPQLVWMNLMVITLFPVHPFVKRFLKNQALPLCQKPDGPVELRAVL